MTPRLATIRTVYGRWTVPAVALAAAAASGWMLHSLDIGRTTAAGSPTHAPDAYMERFVTVEMDGTGQPKRRLEADYMSYHADETVELTNPHYVLFRAGGEPWHVRSERGRVSADGAVVKLVGTVDIWRNDASGARSLDIRTEHLTVRPAAEYGETREKVTIRTPAHTSTGVGMRAYLDETRIELLSQVRTHVDTHRATR